MGLIRQGRTRLATYRLGLRELSSRPSMVVTVVEKKTIESINVPERTFPPKFLSQSKGVCTAKGLGSETSHLEAWLNSLSGPTKSIIKVPVELFGQPVRLDLLHRVSHWECQSARAPSIATKTKATVRGSGKKPRPQKGSGRARIGYRRRPGSVGGGKAHGRHARSFGYQLPKKVRKAALRVLLSTKFQEDNVIFLENASLENVKTQEVLQKLKKLANTENVLVVDGPKFDWNFALAIRNIPKVSMSLVTDLQVTESLRKTKLIITLNGLKFLTLWLSTDPRHQRIWKSIAPILYMDEKDREIYYKKLLQRYPGLLRTLNQRDHLQQSRRFIRKKEIPTIPEHLSVSMSYTMSRAYKWMEKAKVDADRLAKRKSSLN